jgi:hypothetical protein
MCGSSATAASVRLEVRGQQPSTAELRGETKEFALAFTAFWE